MYEVFNSSISPNRLLELKKEIKEEPLKEEKLINTTFKIDPKNRAEDSHYFIKNQDITSQIYDRTSQNTILIQKLWKQFKQLELFFNFLSPTIQGLNEKLEKVELGQNKDGDFRDISDDNILEELGKRKAIIIECLTTQNQMEFHELYEETGIEYKLLKIGLEDLIELGMVRKFEKNETIFYKNSENT